MPAAEGLQDDDSRSLSGVSECNNRNGASDKKDEEMKSHSRLSSELAAAAAVRKTLAGSNKKKKQSKKKQSTSTLISWILSSAVAFTLFQTFTYEPPSHSGDHHHPSNLFTAQPPQLPHVAQQKKQAQQPRNTPEARKDTTPQEARKDQEIPASNNKANNVTALVANTKSSHEHTLVRVLREANVYDSLEEPDLRSLPGLSKTFFDLYGPLPNKPNMAVVGDDGDGPLVYGMETCEAYRQLVPDIRKRYTAPAGMFNTGTNNLELTMQHNLKVTALYQVPWGKHRMEARRLHHKAPGAEGRNQTQCLPVVIIRDPYHWMQSMCKSPYAAHWKHGQQRCPNLVSTKQDRQKWEHLIWDETQLKHQKKRNNDDDDATDSVTPFQVKIMFDKDDVEFFDSLVDVWNEWYRPYWDNEKHYPRLIVRFEDMLLHGPAIMNKVSECMGVEGVPPDKFHYQTNAAKAHGSGANFLKAIIKTANSERRQLGLTLKDKIYAAQHLDTELMEAFQYRLVTD